MGNNITFSVDNLDSTVNKNTPINILLSKYISNNIICINNECLPLLKKNVNKITVSYNHGLFINNLINKNEEIILSNYYDKTTIASVKTYEWWNADVEFAHKITLNNSNIYIIGDVHSSFHSLLDIIFDLEKKNVFVDNTFKLKGGNYIIFLGDLIDRGPYNIEILTFVFILQIANKENVIIINGNHEEEYQYSKKDAGGGTLMEIKEQFKGISEEQKQLFHRTLYYLPTVVFLKLDKIIYQFCHGAFSEVMLKENNSKRLNFFINNSCENMRLDNHYNEGNDYKWGDFYQNKEGYEQNGSRPNYGRKITDEYLKKFNIRIIISGHQDTISNGFLLKEEDFTKSEIELQVKQEYVKFKKGEKKNKLYEIEVTKDRLEQELPIDNISALVTSTATISKGLPVNSYLILSSK